MSPTNHDPNFANGFGVDPHRLQEDRCIRGHLYTDEKVYVNTNGSKTRSCRTCRDARAREVRRAKAILAAMDAREDTIA